MRCCLLMMLLSFAAPALGQEMQNIDVDFRNPKFERKLFTFEGGSSSEEFVFAEPDGLHIKFEPPNVPSRPVGYRLKNMVRGDFSFTAHYELLAAARPDSPSTVGFEMYLMMNTPGAAGPAQCDGLAFTRGMQRQLGPALMF